MDIALALGGGGVKGNAHIGVLRVLDREGFKIRALSGTSAGGLWGGLYAAGFSPDAIEAQMAALDASIYARQSGDGPAMMGLSGVRTMLEEALGDRMIEDLPIRFCATAVDLNSAELVVLRSGRLVDVMLATIAVPGIFPPAELNGRTLIDGGVLDPVPVGLARSLAPNLPVVAVVLSPALDTWGGPQKPRLLDTLPFFATYLARLRIAQALNIFMRSVDIAGAMMTELRLQIDQPEVIIRPDVAHIGLLDAIDVMDVAMRGERAAEEALDALYREVSWRGWLSRRLFNRPIRTGNGDEDGN